MKKLTHEDFSQIQSWVHRHARPLELARFRYHFEGPSPVLLHTASRNLPSGQDTEHRQRYRSEFLGLMTAYRNADGGFGNALEPDSWNPDSTPYTTLKALELLDELALLDKPEALSLIQGALAYLEACPFASEDGWPFNIPSNDAHPHAPWWTYDPNANVYESIGVTTGLCAYILRLAHPDTPPVPKGFYAHHTDAWGFHDNQGIRGNGPGRVRPAAHGPQGDAPDRDRMRLAYDRNGSNRNENERS